MTGITPWASGSAGRLLFLEALTLLTFGGLGGEAPNHFFWRTRYGGPSKRTGPAVEAHY